jgi:hypothetical protein
VLEGVNDAHDGDDGTGGYVLTTNAYDYFSGNNLAIFRPMLDCLHH